MTGFRDFLDEEGLPTNDDRIEFLLPVIKHLGTQKLKTIRLKKTINGVSTESGNAFRKLAPVPTVVPPDPTSDTEVHNLQKNQVLLNWYPKIQAIKRIVDDRAIREHAAVRFRSEYHYALLEYWRSAKVLGYLERADVPRLGRVLDDGDGGMCVSLAEEAASVVGIDLSDRFRDGAARARGAPVR